MGSGRFLPIKVVEGGSQPDFFPNGLLLGVPSYSVGGGATDSWENIYLYHEEPVGNFV